MTDTIYLLIATILGLGGYNWYILTQFHAYQAQANEMIMAMALELQSLGSPNVTIEE